MPMPAKNTATIISIVMPFCGDLDGDKSGRAVTMRFRGQEFLSLCHARLQRLIREELEVQMSDF